MKPVQPWLVGGKCRRVRRARQGAGSRAVILLHWNGKDNALSFSCKGNVWAFIALFFKVKSP